MARIEISGGKPTPQKKAQVGKKVENLVIHDVYILDASISMGSKYDETSKAYHAIHGCYENLVASSKNENATMLSTVCIFASSRNIRFPYTAHKGIPSLTTIKSNWNDGMTALFDAIGLTIRALEKSKKEGELVNVKIFTDGGENDSTLFGASSLRKLMSQKEEEGWTFAFVGMPQDVENVKARLAIDDSNTLVYDGTAKGFNKTMVATMDAMESYSASASRGEDVSLGFYKDIS